MQTTAKRFAVAGLVLLLLAAVGYMYSRERSAADSGTSGGAAGQAGSGNSNGAGAGGQAGEEAQETIDLSAAIDASLSLSREEKATVDGAETDTQAANQTEAELNAYHTVYAQNELN